MVAQASSARLLPKRGVARPALQLMHMHACQPPWRPLYSSTTDFHAYLKS